MWPILFVFLVRSRFYSRFRIDLCTTKMRPSIVLSVLTDLTNQQFIDFTRKIIINMEKNFINFGVDGVLRQIDRLESNLNRNIDLNKFNNYRSVIINELHQILLAAEIEQTKQNHMNGSILHNEESTSDLDISVPRLLYSPRSSINKSIDLQFSTSANEIAIDRAQHLCKRLAKHSQYTLVFDDSCASSLAWDNEFEFTIMHEWIKEEKLTSNQREICHSAVSPTDMIVPNGQFSESAIYLANLPAQRAADDVAAATNDQTPYSELPISTDVYNTENLAHKILSAAAWIIPPPQASNSCEFGIPLEWINKHDQQKNYPSAQKIRNANSIECFICKKKFHRMATLKAHKRNCKNNEAKNVGTNHKHTIVCNLCSKHLYSEATLAKHKEIVHRYTLNCEICRKTFSSRALLRKHTNIHLRTKSFHVPLEY